MPRIEINSEQLQQNVVEVDKKISEFQLLNERVLTLLGRMQDGWEGQFCEKYMETMRNNMNKAQIMEKILQEYRQYVNTEVIL